MAFAELEALPISVANSQSRFAKTFAKLPGIAWLPNAAESHCPKGHVVCRNEQTFICTITPQTENWHDFPNIQQDNLPCPLGDGCKSESPPPSSTRPTLSNHVPAGHDVDFDLLPKRGRMAALRPPARSPRAVCDGCTHHWPDVLLRVDGQALRADQPTLTRSNRADSCRNQTLERKDQ